MSDLDPAELYKRLRESSREMLGIVGDDVGPVQSLMIDLVNVLRLQIDDLQAAALSGKQIDAGRLSDLVKLLKSILPATANEPAVPDFAEAKAGLLALANQRANARGYPKDNDSVESTKMRVFITSLAVLGLLSPAISLAQTANVPPNISMKMEMHGSGANLKPLKDASPLNLDQFPSDIPTHQLSNLAQNPISEAGGVTRSAKDQQIYRAISPSVVLVANKEGFGSGSLLNAAGDILTNWHVVNGYSYVAIIFKPAVEGKEPTRDETKLGRVVQYDEVADLALVRASEVPTGRNAIRLGDPSEIAVGVDVHAIGHPVGETWTYTTGIISQYRQAYEWQAKDNPIKHKADIIQTQTPINPGNSGGPLLSDSGNLIGVNSFIGAGEGLNYAVSVDEVRKFLAHSGNRIAQEHTQSKADQGCQPKQLSKFRNKENDATVVSLDMFCTGKDNAEYVTPDNQSKAIFLRLDRNGDGNVDAVIFDFKRHGKWDLSFWDEKFEGHWTLVGYHDDGSLRPTRFESYTEFHKRLATC